MSREKLLPQNLEAECGVLGSIIIDPDALVLVAEFLSPDDFYRDAHRTIYEAMLRLYERHEAADFLTICDELGRGGKLEAVGGASSITSLINAVPTSGNAGYYGHIVERTSILRRLIHAAGQIAALAYEEVDADAALEQAEQTIFAISQRARSLGGSRSLASLVADYQRKLDRVQAGQDTRAARATGIAGLDRLLGGFKPADLYVVAARTSMGKTALALSLALASAVRYGRRVGIFSVEMSEEQITERLLSLASGIPLHRVMEAVVEDGEWDRLVRAMSVLSETVVEVDQTAVLTPMQLRSRARRWVQERVITLIVVDYLQLLEPIETPQNKGATRTQLVDHLCRSLKLLAREVNVPILLLAQLSRAVEQRADKRPLLSDLRESGGIEQTADAVIFIYRDEVYNPQSADRGLAELLVAKHRNGPTGQVVVAFDAATAQFRDVGDAPLSHSYHPYAPAPASRDDEPEESDDA